jgi:hypothetical protein
MESGKCENKSQQETANGNNSEESRTRDAELTLSGDLERARPEPAPPLS